jgi:CDP-diacylglycerol--glycerol-3-phosphate 3-phosphatidyltransferase
VTTAKVESEGAAEAGSPEQERVISIWPNVASLSRLAVAPILIALLAWTSAGGATPAAWVWWTASIIFALGMATDALDGYLARRLDSVTQFGRMIDPLVDKVLTQSALVMLASISMTSQMVPAWAVALILAREVLITGLRGWAEVAGLDFSASPLGKAKTASQTVAILAAFVFAVPGLLDPVLAVTTVFWLVMLAMTLTLLSGVDYCLRLRRAFQSLNMKI